MQASVDCWFKRPMKWLARQGGSEAVNCKRPFVPPVKRRGRELDMYYRHMAGVFINNTQGMMLCDAAFNVQAVNSAWCRTTGYAERDLVGKKPLFMTLGCFSQIEQSLMLEVLQKTGCWSGSLRQSKKDGTPFQGALLVSTIKNSRNKVSQYIWQISETMDAGNMEVQLDLK